MKSYQCPSVRNPYEADDGVTDLQDRILSMLEDEGIDTATNDKIMSLVAEGERKRFEAERSLDPCSIEAARLGCTCTLSSVNSASIDPPHEVIDIDCPLHGLPYDPDAYYDAQRTGD